MSMVRVSEVSQTDDSVRWDMWAKMWVRLNDEPSEIDDNEISEADMMSDESHETDE